MLLVEFCLLMFLSTYAALLEAMVQILFIFQLDEYA